MSKRKRGKHARILYSSTETFKRRNRKKARVARKNIFQLMILIMVIAFFANIQNMMAYFTSSDSSVNEFSIDAEYTVSFNNNGETGTMEPQVISYNVPTNLSANTFTSTDYIFNGWNTKADGTGTGYTNGASVTNLGDITLYAQWREPNAIFDTGTNVNIKMKNLAGDNATERNYPDTNITAIKKSETEPLDANKNANNIVSASTSPDPIYMWYDNGIIYWWSKDTTPALNEDASGMFRNFSNLTDISGLESFDASNASSLMTTFANDYLMLDYSPIYNWNISNVASIRSMFQNNYIVETINLSNWDTRNVTSTYNMFARCYKLNEINLNNWNTAKVTDMSHMFQDCISLSNISLNSFTTTQVTDMNNMFESCSLLEELDLRNFDTSNVTDMSFMFSFVNPNDESAPSACTNIYLGENFDTSNVINMHCMFQNCTNLNSLNLGKKFKTSNVTDMHNMFYLCSSLTSLDISNFDMSSVTDSRYMLGRCTSLEELKTPKVYPTDTSVTIALPVTLYDTEENAYTTLGGATTPVSPTETWIKLGYTVEFNANNGTGTMPNQKIQIGTATALKENTFTRTDYIFDGWNTEADGSGTTYADRASVTNLASANGSITLYAKWKEEYEAIFDTGTNVNIKMKNLAGDNVSAANVADTNITAIKKSTTEPTSANKTANNIVSTSTSPYPIYMWYDSGTIYWWSEDTTPALNSDASAMFRNFSNLTDISGLENFDASKTKNMTTMFGVDSSLTNINSITNWNVTSLENMQTMFVYAGITNIDLSNWNTINLKNTAGTFQHCSNLISINLVNDFDTCNVESMQNMFSYCANLKILNLGDKFDTSKVSNMSAMFGDCTSLTSLNLANNFNTSEVTTMSYMFNKCYNLSKLDISSFDMAKVSDASYMLETNTLLQELKTPTAYPTDTSKTIILPKTLYDSNGTAYTTLGGATTPTSPTQTILKETWE